MCYYLCVFRPGHLAIQQCIQGVTQMFFSLWTVTTDNVTGGTNAFEEV